MLWGHVPHYSYCLLVDRKAEGPHQPSKILGGGQAFETYTCRQSSDRLQSQERLCTGSSETSTHACTTHCSSSATLAVKLIERLEDKSPRLQTVLMFERIDWRDRKWILLIASIILDIISGASFGMPLIGEESFAPLCPENKQHIVFIGLEMRNIKCNQCAGLGSHMGTSLVFPSHTNVFQ